MALQSSESYAQNVICASSAAEVIKCTREALESPSVFFFGDLLRALRTYQNTHGADGAGDVARWMAVVELLTHATFDSIDECAADVKALIAEHPVITEKLRVLSLLTLCSQHTMSTVGICIPYEEVERVAGVRGVIAVQAVVLTAVQRKLCTARLDERAATVRVYAYESRDVQEREVAALKQRLEEWTTYAKAQLRDMQ